MGLVGEDRSVSKKTENQNVNISDGEQKMVNHMNISHYKMQHVSHAAFTLTCIPTEANILQESTNI